MTISPTSIVVAGKDQVTSDVAGEAVILHMRSGRYYGLAQVGARIWHLISEPKRVSEIRDAIVQEYDVAVDRCERDVVTLLEEMAEQGLVDVRSDP
jgi:hypothetical protein